jgi:hypothetical protein
MLPSHATTPSTLPGETYYGYTFVPITDEQCWIYTYAWNPDRPIGTDERAKLQSGHSVVAEIGPDYVPLRNINNNYMIDREEQRFRTFTGIRGVAEQDAMAQEGQGPIADRTREHLAPSDVGVLRFRHTVMNEARALAEGREPSAPWKAESYRLRSGSWVAPATVPFEEVLKQRFGNSIGRGQQKAL